MEPEMKLSPQQSRVVQLMAKTIVSMFVIALSCVMGVFVFWLVNMTPFAIFIDGVRPVLTMPWQVVMVYVAAGLFIIGLAISVGSLIKKWLTPKTLYINLPNGQEVVTNWFAVGFIIMLIGTIILRLTGVW